jgi:hypothetical protein
MHFQPVNLGKELPSPSIDGEKTFPSSAAMRR